MKLTPLSAVLAIFSAIVLAAAGINAAFAQQAPSKGPAYQDVAPIFQTRCTQCHAGPKAPKGLRLDTYDDILKSGDSKNLVPGKPKESSIVLRITGVQKPRMPKNGPPWLSGKETALIEQWIEMGASR